MSYMEEAKQIAKVMREIGKWADCEVEAGTMTEDEWWESLALSAIQSLDKIRREQNMLGVTDE